MLSAPFVYDDRVVIEKNQLLHSLSGLAEIFRGHVDHEWMMDGTYRPIFLSILAAIGWLGGFSPFLFRSVSLLLHAFNAFLLFRLGNSFFRLPKSVSLVAALLFLLHPIQMINIGLVWKQSDLWIATCALSSLLLIGSKPWVAATIFLFSLGIKENSLILPLFWLAAERLQKREGRKLRISLSLFGLAVGVVYFKFLLPDIPQSFRESVLNPASRFDYFSTQLSVLWLYAKAIGNPFLLTIDRNVMLVTHREWTHFVQAGLVILTFSLILFHAIFRRRIGWMALLFAVLWLIPTSSFQPLALLYDETRMYLTLGFLALSIGALLVNQRAQFSMNPKMAWAATLFITLLFAMSSFIFSYRWKSEDRLWRAALEVDPYSVRAHYFLGVKAQEERALDEAEAEYLLAISAAPEFPPPYLNLGIVLGQKGNLGGAREMFTRVLDKGPYWNASGHYHLGLDALYRNDRALAREHFTASLKIAPELGLGWKGEAIVLAQEGKSAEAVATWKKYASTPGVPLKEIEHPPKEIARLVGSPPVR